MSIDSGRQIFVEERGFPLDAFQVQALDVLDRGNSVVVAAPTGSGKTVVADYAINLALRQGQKAFYTTPLKALSNQKYGELVAQHGSERVGLLTGDNTINGDAPAIVMTTEVLRNMIYAESEALRHLRFVVLDEVHYLQNAYRGPVWEEVIIHLPQDVKLVCLSATVSNSNELAEWIETVRGDTEVVLADERPIELVNLYMLGDRQSDGPTMAPVFHRGAPNSDLSQLDSRGWRSSVGRGRPRARFYTPRRGEVVDHLEAQDMLPAIYFIFSRAACDDAVRQCLAHGLRLTTSEERAEIRRIADRRTESLSDRDLDVLEYDEWLLALQSGLAAHHAGMVPPFKEVVEECFSKALVKVVFATETLALGINMPARTVVIEKLTKFTGERHEFLTPGEYTQLTGRAGRRGIDTVGYAVVLWSPFVPFDQVAGLAGAKSFNLTSSFRPTFNMAANLVVRYDPETARHLLNLSFAQFRADAEVVRLESDLERIRRQLAESQEAATCELGDVAHFALAQPQRRSQHRRAREDDRVGTLEALRKLKPGDVVIPPGGRGNGRGVILSTTQRRGGDTRVRVLTSDRKVLAFGPDDFRSPPSTIGHIELPAPYAPNTAAFKREVVDRLRTASVQDNARSRRRHADPDTGASDSGDDPVAACPHLDQHLRALARVERLKGHADRVKGRIRQRTESIARQFDRVLTLLESWGYVDDWSLTERGERLRRIFHESDLLVAEALSRQLMDGLDDAEMSAIASTFTFEARGSEDVPPPPWPTDSLADRWARLERLWAELNDMEGAAGLPLTRAPDPGFVHVAYGWAKGGDLSEVLRDEPLSGGDFVRNSKQLIDLLRQIGDAAPSPAVAAAARRAAEAMFRDIVEASSAIGESANDTERDAV